MSEKTNKALYIALSLLIAILFWLFVDNEQGNTISQTYTNIPVEFIGAEDTLPGRGLMLASGENTTITLKLSGPRMVISDLKKEDIRIQVDLTNIASVGTYQLTYKALYPDDVNRSSITVDRASLSTVTVSVIELFEKEVPVDVSVVGELPDDYIYMAEKLVVDPSTLTLSGREEDVDQVQSALIVVDLQGAESTLRRELEYQLLDGEGNVIENSAIRVSDKRIEVTAPIYIKKTLDLTVNLKEAPGSMAKNAYVSIDPLTIEVAGEAANLEGKTDIVLGELDLSSLLSDTTLSMSIKLPSGCENISGYSTANVSVKFQGLETRVFTVTNVSIIGKGADQEVSCLTNVVEVMVRGPVEELDQVTAEDIRVVANVEEYTSKGTFSIPAEVFVDGFGNTGAVGPYSVRCRIS